MLPLVIEAIQDNTNPAKRAAAVVALGQVRRTYNYTGASSALLERRNKQGLITNLVCSVGGGRTEDRAHRCVHVPCALYLLIDAYLMDACMYLFLCFHVCICASWAWYVRTYVCCCCRLLRAQGRSCSRMVTSHNCYNYSYACCMRAATTNDCQSCGYVQSTLHHGTGHLMPAHLSLLCAHSLGIWCLHQYSATWFVRAGVRVCVRTQVLGIVGALDPHTHKTNLASLSGEGKLEKEGVRPLRRGVGAGGAVGTGGEGTDGGA